MAYKVLNIDASTGYYRVERYPIGEVLGPLDVGMRLYDRTDGLTVGSGLLAGSVMPGSNRLIVCGRSPTWGGFYVSTMGGAALTFDNLGIDALHIRGRHAVPAVLVLNREHGEEVRVRVEAVPLPEIWRGYGGEIGFYALSHWIWDRWSGEYASTPRAIAVGPAAAATDFGALGSLVPYKKQLTPVDTWAGRGGFGSKLLKGHNLCGILYGGTFVDEDFRDRSVADSWFEQQYQKRMKIKDYEATTKYRFDPEFGTGGTFGVNYARMGHRILAFNYRTVHWSEDNRSALHERLVVGHYLRQFNEETIEPRLQRTCGEPCAAVCKKMRGPYKKDYEPYQAMGPLIGVFDQRAAERVVRHGDACGFDAIQLGGVLAWLFECLDVGALAPEELGLPGRPRFHPDLDPVADSAHNADLAVLLIDSIAAGREPLDLSDGARSLARRLAARTGDRRFVDLLVVTAFGNRGWMVPNQYWTPGMFAPMAVMGKYYEYYGEDYHPPQELGRLCAERMAREMMIDNAGMCRFHRGWAEDLLPTIYRDLFGEEVDILAHHRRLARRVSFRSMPIPWEGERTIDIVETFLRRKKSVDAVESADLDMWLARFGEDRAEAALDYWYELHKGVMKALVRGS